MKNIEYTPQSNIPLQLGYQYDHKARTIHFGGFRHAPENMVYIKLETDPKGLIPLADNAWEVGQPYTNKAGVFEAQLVELGKNNELISSSPMFRAVVKEALEADGQYEIHDPDLDLWTQKVKALYDEVLGKLESGDLKGEPGDKGDPFRYEDFTPEQLEGLKGKPGKDGNDYILTESDKHEIAGMVHVEEKHITEYVENPYNDAPIKKDISSVKKDYNELLESSNQLKSGKLDKPVDTPEVGKVLKIKQVNDDGSFVCEWADAPTPDLADYVKNTDYATGTKGGVVKMGDQYAFSSDNGFPRALIRTIEQYNNSSKNMFVGKGTLENILPSKIREESYYFAEYGVDTYARIKEEYNKGKIVFAILGGNAYMLNLCDDSLGAFFGFVNQYGLYHARCTTSNVWYNNTIQFTPTIIDSSTRVPTGSAILSHLENNYEPKKGDWVLKGTITKANSYLALDMSDCTEMCVFGDLTNCNGINCKANNSSKQLVYASISGTNETRFHFVAKSKKMGIVISSAKYSITPNIKPLTLNLTTYEEEDFFVNDITNIVFSGTIESINVEIWAR